MLAEVADTTGFPYVSSLVQKNTREKLPPVKFMVAAGAYSWRR